MRGLRQKSYSREFRRTGYKREVTLLPRSCGHLGGAVECDGVETASHFVGYGSHGHTSDEPESRSSELYLLADALASSQRYDDAITTLQQLTSLRRHPSDWLLLAMCERNRGRLDAEIEALATAVRINPRLTNVHKILAEHFEKKGDRDRATWHRQRANP